MQRGLFPGAATAVAAMTAVFSCTGSAAAEGLPVRVVTSIPPLAMLVSELGGDRVVAHSILPPGADPHTFEPRPSDAVAVAEADVVVVLGSSIDDWVGGAMATREGAAMVRLDEPAGAQGSEARDEHGHGEGGHDPHVWLDPLWVRDRAVPALQRALSAADPAGASRYGYSARAMAEGMTNLDDDIREMFALASTRNFLAWHPAWTRFAHRFDLHPVGGVAESEGIEPSLRAMIGAVRAARAAGVRAVLVEPQTDPRQAAVLAEELGLPLVTVDPIGDAWSVDRATYRTLLLFNARAFARALAVVKEDEAGGPAPVSAPARSSDAH